MTPTGCELITRDVPVAADEIEALMREARAAHNAAHDTTHGAAR